MSETYVECLIKKEASSVVKACKLSLYIMVGMFAVGGLLFPLFLFIALLGGFLAYFINLNTDLEYEYLYLDKEITVDVIKAKAKRKRMARISVDRLEILAPIRSHHLDSYKNRDIKAKDYSTGIAQQPDGRYVLIYDGTNKIIISPSEEFVKAIRNVAPRKVFMD